MKKIMFNNKYRLTQAVLEEIKTQDRMIIQMDDDDVEYLDTAFDWDLRESVIIDRYAKYKVGEIVAVAQSYKDCGYSVKQYDTSKDSDFGYLTGCGFEEIPMKWPINGYSNKMFVRAELMPNKIRITNVRIERLQDISDEDCLKEGVVVNDPKIKCGFKSYYPCQYLRECANKVGWVRVYNTPREAFSQLINKVRGKDTWERNPYVFVYEFELVE